MKKFLFLSLLVLGAVALLPGSASAVTGFKPRPGPVVVPVSPDPEPVVSAN